MNINLKSFLYLPIILLFFQAFYFPLCGKSFAVFYLFLHLGLILCFINYKDFIRKMAYMMKNTPFKWFVILIIYMICNTLFLVLIGFAPFAQSVYTILIQLILGIIPVTLYFLYIIDKYISFDKFMQFFIITLWSILILGFVAYIGQFFDIKLINSFFDICANERLIRSASQGLNLDMASNYFAYGLPRLDNLCDEPSAYARTLFILLPFVYAFADTKIQIADNKLLDITIKKTLIPFTWLSILLTFSPIYLILCFLITFIYYFKEILYNLKKYIAIICLIVLAGIFILSCIDLSETYLSRIINVLTRIHSFDDFILVEPSLATRICSFINSFCVFLQHPITGVGLGNLATFQIIYNQYLHSPVSLTYEIITRTNIAMLNGGVPFVNIGFIYAFLAENGIIAATILYWFFIKLIHFLNVIVKNNNDNKIYTYQKSLKYSLIAILIISFYNSYYTLNLVYFVAALALSFLYREQNSENLKSEVE